MRALVLCLVAGLVMGCQHAPPPRSDALVIAACPKLAPVDLKDYGDSMRLHIEDAQQYNRCRCAALAGTSEACPVPAKSAAEIPTESP